MAYNKKGDKIERKRSTNRAEKKAVRAKRLYNLQKNPQRHTHADSYNGSRDYDCYTDRPNQREHAVIFRLLGFPRQLGKYETRL